VYLPESARPSLQETRLTAPKETPATDDARSATSRAQRLREVCLPSHIRYLWGTIKGALWGSVKPQTPSPPHTQPTDDARSEHSASARCATSGVMPGQQERGRRGGKGAVSASVGCEEYSLQYAPSGRGIEGAVP
jgi:hypothetical protein